MKKIMFTIALVLYGLFPTIIKADNSECVFKNLTEKSSYVPGEIITLEYGMMPMPSSAVGYGINFYIAFDPDYFEVVKQSDELVTTTIDWEDNSSKIVGSFEDIGNNYTLIEVKSSTLDETKYLKEGTIYDAPYTIGNIKLKVKNKVNSGIGNVMLVHNEGDDYSEIFQDNFSTFSQYLINDEGETKENEGACFNKNELGLKIVNKDDDAYISGLKITYYGDETTTKEINALPDFDYEEEVSKDIKKIKIEAACLGNNCKVTGTGEYDLGEDVYILKVESDTSIRKYGIRIYREESEEISEQLSSMIIEEEPIDATLDIENDNDMVVVFGIVFGIIVLVAIVVLIIVFKMKEKKKNKEEKKKDDVNTPYIPIERDENGNIISKTEKETAKENISNDEETDK